MAAVIGDPVAHSLSPAIHNAAFAAAGIDARLRGPAGPGGRPGRGDRRRPRLRAPRPVGHHAPQGRRAGPPRRRAARRGRARRGQLRGAGGRPPDRRQHRRRRVRGRPRRGRRGPGRAPGAGAGGRRRRSSGHPVAGRPRGWRRWAWSTARRSAGPWRSSWAARWPRRDRPTDAAPVRRRGQRHLGGHGRRRRRRRRPSTPRCSTPARSWWTSSYEPVETALLAGGPRRPAPVPSTASACSCTRPPTPSGCGRGPTPPVAAMEAAAREALRKT